MKKFTPTPCVTESLTLAIEHEEARKQEARQRYADRLAAKMQKALDDYNAKPRINPSEFITHEPVSRAGESNRSNGDNNLDYHIVEAQRLAQKMAARGISCCC